MGSTRVLRFLLAVSALSLSGGVVQAQRYWHDDQGRDAFRIDAWMPFLKGDGHKFFTGAMVPSASIRVGDGFRVEADLPLVRASQDFGGIAGTQSAVRIGNPYIGLRIGEDAKPVAGSLGLRLPIGQDPKDAAGQQAVAVGAIANFDDFEAYTPDVMTFRGTLEYRKVGAKNFLFGVKGGPSLQTNISGDPTIDSEISLDYGGRFGYDGAGADRGIPAERSPGPVDLPRRGQLSRQVLRCPFRPSLERHPGAPSGRRSSAGDPPSPVGQSAPRH